MSTRWYPIYQQGNPQLRVFLSNFWMKILPTRKNINKPPNQVVFECSPEMSKFDVENYLKNIYKLEIINVETANATGRFKKAPYNNYIIKEDDRKIAFVTLPKDVVFEFPNHFEKGKDVYDNHQEQVMEQQKSWDEYKSKHKHRKGIPSFFGL